MKCVTYNIQYGIGLDGRYDIGRIAEAIRGADVICLQEVTRNAPQNGGRDMVAEIRAALPDYFAVYGPNFEADVGSHLKDGRAVEVFLQFGNMVLSKTPVRASRNLLLPRGRSYEKLNLQRGALEALIETPLGFMRFYSVHLDHRGPDELHVHSIPMERRPRSMESASRVRWREFGARPRPSQRHGWSGTVPVRFPFH